MKVEYLNPFTEAAFYVLSEVIFDDDIQRGELSIRKDPMVSTGVSTVIGLTGDLQGHVVYDMDRKTAIAIATEMNGEPMPGLNDLVRSTINELANMISGNATAKLSENGYNCDITPPTFIVGVDSELYAHKGMQHIVIPLKSKCGTIILSLAVSEKG